jgi:N-acetylglutamate synthase-like GNAT family acetyltransferase
VHPAARNLGKGKELLQALDQRISENPTIKNIFFQTENKRMGLIGLNNGYEHVPEEYCFIRRIKE